MEREVSIVVEIGVMLAAISLVIGIVWFTVYMGNSIFSSASEQGSDILVAVECGALDDMTENDNIMPASAAYSLLRKYSLSIPEYVCKFCNISQDITSSEAPCIVNHLTGKVSLQVEYLDTGGYKVIIHKVNCSWYSLGIDKCTCN